MCFRSWKVITNIIIQDLVGLLRSCNYTCPGSESHLPTFCCSASDLTFHHGGSASPPISVTCQIEGEDSPYCGCLWLSIPKHITCCSSSIISPLYIYIHIKSYPHNCCSIYLYRNPQKPWIIFIPLHISICLHPHWIVAWPGSKNRLECPVPSKLKKCVPFSWRMANGNPDPTRWFKRTNPNTFFADSNKSKWHRICTSQ